jgi:hypothetical protein
MTAEPAANTRTTEILAPILGTHLVSVFHGHLRALAENLEKKRGQPPKTSLAAAKVLYQRVGDRAVAAIHRSGVDSDPDRNRQRKASADQASSAAAATDVVNLDDLSEQGIAHHLEDLEHWLSDGSWLSPPYDLPPLLGLIEEVVGVDRGDGSDAADSQSVVGLLEQYRTMVDWAEAFLLQRPDDQAGRDEVVLLTVARLNILTAPQTAGTPLQAAAILNRPYERLDERWGDDTAIGVTTFSKGHFGNDQAAFNDVCRSFVVDLLYRALRHGRPKTIYLSTTIFDQSTGSIRAELDQKIIDCLAGGWRVVHVLNRGGDNSPSARARVQADFATHLLAHMQTKGAYVPVPSVVPDSTDMALVEGVGAVVFPSVGYGTGTNKANAPPSPAMAVRCITGRGGSGDGPAATPIVAELRAEARAVFAHRTEAEDAYLDRRSLPFGYRLPTDNLLWFDRQLAASELLEGERYALKGGLTTSTLPDHLSAAQFDAWRHQLELLAAGSPDTEGLVRGWSATLVDLAQEYIADRGFDEIVGALRRLRHKRAVRHFSFETNTMNFRYRDCLLTSELERYLTDERIWYSTNLAYGGGGLTLEQRHEHGLYVAQQLENTRVNLELGDRTGYNLGLIGSDMSQPYDIRRTWWLATESRDRRADQVHFLHQPRRSSTAYVATLKADSVAHFDAVRTFASLFDAVWYTIEIKDRFPATVTDYVLDLLPETVRREFARIDQIGLAR